MPRPWEGIVISNIKGYLAQWRLNPALRSALLNRQTLIILLVVITSASIATELRVAIDEGGVRRFAPTALALLGGLLVLAGLSHAARGRHAVLGEVARALITGAIFCTGSAVNILRQEWGLPFWQGLIMVTAVGAALGLGAGGFVRLSKRKSIR